MNFITRISKSPGSLWPYAIIGWFVIFASALAAWISFAVRQSTDLVRPDYYEEEVRFQNQLDRLSRTATLRGKIAIEYDAALAEVSLKLPVAAGLTRPAGRIHFYRPSNAALDFDVPLDVDANGRQRINVRTRPGGQWKIRVHWNVSAEDYFIEKTLVLDASPGLTAAAGKDVK